MSKNGDATMTRRPRIPASACEHRRAAFRMPARESPGIAAAPGLPCAFFHGHRGG